MSRPKGSKNKKTLEKEKEKIFKLKQEQEPKLESKLEPKKEPEKEPEPKKEPIEEPIANEPDNEEEEEYIELPPPEPKKPKSSIKNLKPDEYCLKCNQKLSETPYRIDTQAITQIPAYHRDHPRFIKLCRKCALELSEVIDEWLDDYPDKFDPIVKEDN